MSKIQGTSADDSMHSVGSKRKQPDTMKNNTTECKSDVQNPKTRRLAATACESSASSAPPSSILLSSVLLALRKVCKRWPRIRHMLTEDLPASVSAPTLLNWRDTGRQWTLLMLCVAAKDIHGVRYLLGLGADVESRGPAGWSPLLLCCERGNACIAKLLLDARANPDCRNATTSALAAAASNGCFHVVTLLLQRGAQANRLLPFPPHTALDRALAMDPHPMFFPTVAVLLEKASPQQHRSALYDLCRCKAVCNEITTRKLTGNRPALRRCLQAVLADAPAVLQSAVHCGNKGMVRVCLQLKADMSGLCSENFEVLMGRPDAYETLEHLFTHLPAAVIRRCLSMYGLSAAAKNPDPAVFSLYLDQCERLEPLILSVDAFHLAYTNMLAEEDGRCSNKVLEMLLRRLPHEEDEDTLMDEAEMLMLASEDPSHALYLLFSIRPISAVILAWFVELLVFAAQCQHDSVLSYLIYCTSQKQGWRPSLGEPVMRDNLEDYFCPVVPISLDLSLSEEQRRSMLTKAVRILIGDHLKADLQGYTESHSGLDDAAHARSHFPLFGNTKSRDYVLEHGLRSLLANGADPSDEECLVLAASSGSYVAMEVLVDAGAKPRTARSLIVAVTSPSMNEHQSASHAIALLLLERFPWMLQDPDVISSCVSCYQAMENLTAKFDEDFKSEKERLRSVVDPDRISGLTCTCDIPDHGFRDPEDILADYYALRDFQLMITGLTWQRQYLLNVMIDMGATFELCSCPYSLDACCCGVGLAQVLAADRLAPFIEDAIEDYVCEDVSDLILFYLTGVQLTYTSKFEEREKIKQSALFRSLVVKPQH